jgi:hypothetical protein
MTNTVPADALSRADSLLNGSPDPITPLNEINPEVPSEVSDVILHGMEVSQERRFSTAKEMQKTLRKAFTQMQEAMSAQTVAFSSPAVEHTSRIEQPLGAVESMPTPTNGADSEATRLRSDPSPFQPAEPIVQSGNVPADSLPKQSDIKTEVYSAGSMPVYTPVVESSPAAPPPDNSWGVSEPEPANDFSPDATTPNVNFDPASLPASPFGSNETFSTPAPSTEDDFSTRVEPTQSHPEPLPLVQPVAKPAAKKGSSKAIWVVGGLAALFIFGIVAAGVGWFVYSNYYAATAAVEPAPTPEPTLEAVPTPEPTLEAVTDTNSNTNSTIGLESNSNSNSNADLTTVEPTPVPESPTEVRDNTPTRSTQQTEVRRPATSKTNPVQPTSKPTPKKTNRTVILQ